MISDAARSVARAVNSAARTGASAEETIHANAGAGGTHVDLVWRCFHHRDRSRGNMSEFPVERGPDTPPYAWHQTPASTSHSRARRS
jgi:hypothetical protein